MGLSRRTIAVAALLSSAGALELLCRVLLPGWQPPPVEVPFFRFDPRLGWSLRPGYRGDFDLPGSRTRVEISSQGLRDREYSAGR